MTERALVSQLWMLLVCVSCLRILLTLGHYSAVADFVRSKPPGRKMVTRFSAILLIRVYIHVTCVQLQVTSDINVFACFFGDIGKKYQIHLFSYLFT